MFSRREKTVDVVIFALKEFFLAQSELRIQGNRERNLTSSNVFVTLDLTPSFYSEATSKVSIITQKEKPSSPRSQQTGSFLFLRCLRSFSLGSSLQSQVLHNNNLQKHMELTFFNLC